MHVCAHILINAIMQIYMIFICLLLSYSYSLTCFLDVRCCEKTPEEQFIGVIVSVLS